MSGPRKIILPTEVLSLRSQLVGCDVWVLALLHRHIGTDGWCWRSQRRMADELGLDRVTVMRSLHRLVAVGVVRSERVRNPNGGNGSCRYQVAIPEAQLSLFSVADAGTGVQPTPESSATPPPGGMAASAPESPGDSTPESPGDSTGTFYSERRRKTDADDARARRRSRGGKRADPQQRPLPLGPVLVSENPSARSGASPAGAVPREVTPSAVSAVVSEPDAVPAVGVPDAVPDDRPAADAVPGRAELDRLETSLREAAGASLNAVSTSLMLLSDPLRWLATGCVLELDIVPALRAVAARKKAGEVKTWAYFNQAVFEARDRRTAAAPAPEASRSPSPEILSPSRGGQHAARHPAERLAAAFRRVSER
jgi:hypothetical protein